MKNILIVCDGILAKKFIETIVKLKNIHHNYVIVYKSDKTLPEVFFPDNMEFYQFDPTSKERLRSVINGDFSRFMVILDDKFEAQVVYENLRDIQAHRDIFIVDMWNGTLKLRANDEFVKFIDMTSIICQRLTGFLPDNPIFADNIGLGIGEIMEVKVPVGSSFAYRKVGLFNQNKFQIPLIYRQNRYIITKSQTTIMPNDSLLLTGEPAALKNIFNAIKKEKGQFPSPYGINIYLLIDLKEMTRSRFSKLIQTAQYLNEVLKNHLLYIRVINPTLNEYFDEIKSLSFKNSCEVLVDYKNTTANFMGSDIKRFNIGFVVVENDFFEEYKESLYRESIPVLTLGDGDIKAIKKGIIVTNDRKDAPESSVVYDVCEQFGMDIYLYYYDQNITSTKEIIKHYKELSELFKKELIIVDKEENPIKILEKKKDFLQFIPFTKKILNRGLAAPFMRDFDLLYYALRSNYQLFIPSSYEI